MGAPGRACFPIDALNGQGRAYDDIAAPQLPPDVSLAYTYGDPAHAHAVTALGDSQYAYDPNGNQIERNIANDGQYQLLYDAENRVVEVKKDSATIAQFTYDGDGRRVIAVENGQTTVFVGTHYEKTGSQITKYYFAGSTRIAMRKYTIPQNMTVEYILADHLGSTSLTTDSTGTKTSEMRYNPWGQTRYAWTTSLSTTPAYQLTRYTYTGQYSHMDDPTTAGVTEGFGLMFYNARWYDPGLGRFAQADSIVPPGAQGLDRYAYVNNSPVKYKDPTGHFSDDQIRKWTEYKTKADLKYLKENNPRLYNLLRNLEFGDHLFGFKPGSDKTVHFGMVSVVDNQLLIGGKSMAEIQRSGYLLFATRQIGNSAFVVYDEGFEYIGEYSDREEYNAPYKFSEVDRDVSLAESCVEYICTSVVFWTLYGLASPVTTFIAGAGGVSQALLPIPPGSQSGDNLWKTYYADPLTSNKIIVQTHIIRNGSLLWSTQSEYKGFHFDDIWK